MDFGPNDLGKLYSEKHAEALAELGRFNLAIFGKTGTGKSTLINSVFGQTVAATGTGKPVTTGIDYYQHPDVALGIYDSQGFETGMAGEHVLDALEAIVNESRDKPISEQIHAIWYTLRWSDRRFENSQADFVRRLVELKLPVVFVITQVPKNDAGHVHADALTLADYVVEQGLPLSPDNTVFLTNALPDAFLGTEVFGLTELLDATYSIIPEAARLALTSAQQIDRGRKRQASKGIITASASTAAATGATPIPFSDAAILIPLQIGMIARITTVYGLQLPSNKVASLVGSLIMSSGATTAGRWIVSSLLRVVPGGQPAAMVISGSVAAALTTAMGWAWVAVLEQQIGQDPDAPLQVETVRDVFTEEFKKRLKLKKGPKGELEAGD